MYNLLELIEGRSGEKLIQGLLIYTLRVDEDFRKKFCEWLELGEPDVQDVLNHIGEEESQKEPKSNSNPRYDIKIRCKKKGKTEDKHIELKLWASKTPLQEKTETYDIHAVIVPKSREEYFKDWEGIGKKLCFWEDFEKVIISCASFSLPNMLFSGLTNHFRFGLEISVEEIIGDLKKWTQEKNWKDKIGPFLSRIKAAMDKWPKLKVTNGSSSLNLDRLYWGKYIYNSSIKDKGHLIWYGFSFEKKSPEKFRFSINWPKKLHSKLDGVNDYSDIDDEGWYYKRVEPSTNGKYNYSDFLEQIEDILDKFAE